MKLISKYSLLLSSLFLFLFCLPLYNQAFAVAEWEIVSSQNVTDKSNHFNSISHVSANDIWAVGASVSPNNANLRQALIEHYDGANWSIIPGPNEPTLGDNVELNGVEAISSDNVWAVGATYSHTLIEHWDGTAWNIITSPNAQDSYANTLTGITANSANDIWAVGSYKSSTPGPTYSMIQRYDGTGWNIVYTSPINTSNEYLTAVAAVNGNDVWAVGASIDGYANSALIKHWDGNTWSDIPIPQPNDAIVSQLLGIVANSANDIWAVGSYVIADNSSHALIMHFDGSTWSIVPESGLEAFPKALYAIAATSANDIWAVGDRDTEIRIIHYNGTTWEVVQSPSNNPVSSPFSLRAITSVTSDNVWAAGVSQNQTLIEHYSSGANPTPTPSFDILTNGYNFDNLGLDATWSTFESTFGSAQVNGVKKPFAKAYFDTVFLPVLRGGNCFGMSASSLLFYTGNGNQNLLTQYNSSNAHELPAPGNYINFNPNFNFLDSFWTSTPVSQYIAKYQGWATSREFQVEYMGSENLEILDLYESIKQNLQQGTQDPFVIGLATIDGKRGHSVVPYKTEEQIDGTKRIYVYDPNNPCKPDALCEPLDPTDPDPYSRYIKIGSGAYPDWEFDFYNGNFTKWENPYLYLVPVSHIDDTPTLPFTSDSPYYRWIYVKGLSDLFITNSQGNGIGYQNGVFVNDLSGANIIVPPLNSTERAIPSYKLPSGAYSIFVQGARTETNNIDIFGPNTLLQIANLPVATGSADTISTDESHRSLTITTEETNKTYDANLFVELEGTHTREYNVRGLSVAQGESDTVKMTNDNNSVEITNQGAADTFNVTIKQTGESEEVLEYNQSITIQNGETMQISPSDWENLDTASLLINNTTPNKVQIMASPFMRDVAINTPFTVDVKISSDTSSAFNAARANVSVASNLQVLAITTPKDNACNFQYTKTPTKANPSFAGALFGSFSTGCTVYTLVLKPKTAGTGTITFSNAAVKSYEDNSELLDSVVNGEYIIPSAQPTATPTLALTQLTVTSPLKTYLTNFNLAGTKDARITQVFVNGSAENSTYPTSTTWQVPVTLPIGANNFTLYGKDSQGNQTATKTITVSRHMLGDINGDGEVDLIDASLFAVDWSKTATLIYNLSDMNGDGVVDLTDLSILAKLQN